MHPKEHAKLALLLPFIPCPNCTGKLVAKEKVVNYCNIHCLQCAFAARFVVLGENDARILSINSAELDAIVAAKATLPPFIFYRRWKHEGSSIEFEEAVFYPFIPFSFLAQPAQAIPITGQADDTLLYILYDDLPSQVIYNSPSDAEMADMVSQWQKLSATKVQARFHIGYARSANIVDEAKKIRRRKGLPVENQFEEEESQDDDEEE